MKQRRLDIIGAGKVGRVLARLWHEAGLVSVGKVHNRSVESAAAACAFIGAGTPVAMLGELGEADLLMIAASDREIAALATVIAAAGIAGPAATAFHCSGALPAALLAPLRANGAATGSLHPVKSFADPVRALGSFAGTYCGLEGDAAFAQRLAPLVTAVGGQPFVLAPGGKTLYHAGIVYPCNFLPVLMQAGLDCLSAAGVGRDMAMRLLEPLIRGTVDNIFALGPAAALTGPAARGDAEVVAAQEAALRAADPALGDLYRQLSELAVRLAAQKV